MGNRVAADFIHRKSRRVRRPMVTVNYPVEKITASSTFRREHLGHDSRFGLNPDDWVEIIDDGYVLRGQVEPLLRVETVDVDKMQVTQNKAHLRDLPPQLHRNDGKKSKNPCHHWLRKNRGIEIWGYSQAIEKSLREGGFFYLLLTPWDLSSQAMPERSSYRG